MVYPALLPLMRTPRLPAVDWTDAPTGRFKWTLPFRTKDEIWFMRVWRHISTGPCCWQLETLVLWLHAHFGVRNTEHHAFVRPLLLTCLSVGFGWWFLSKLSDSISYNSSNIVKYFWIYELDVPSARRLVFLYVLQVRLFFRAHSRFITFTKKNNTKGNVPEMSFSILTVWRLTTHIWVVPHR